MDYRARSKPPVQRVHVKVHAISRPPITQNVRSVTVRPVISIPKSVRKHAVQSPTPPTPPPPTVIQKPMETQVRPPIAPVREFKKRLGGKQINPLAVQHNNLLKEYKDSIDRIRCIGNSRILAIVACGPSILEADLEKLKNQPEIDLMCINKPEARLWPTPYWMFCDQSQFARNKDIWEKYSGQVINASSVRARHRRQILIKSISGRGFSRDLGKGFYIGRSSTYAAMQVALWMNYSKIYIFGVDMCAVDGKLHFYGKNPDVNDANRIQRFDREAESYLYAATDVLKPEERDRFVFCSSYNKYKFVDYYQRLHQKKAVDIILEEALKLRR